MTDDIKFMGGARDDWSEPADAIDAMYQSMPDEMLDDSDLGLITDYLTNQLPAERVAEVQWRLERDQKFRELAAPLVLAWSIAPKWKREPMPRAEIVRSWDEFTRRAGFVHQRRKARLRRWLFGVALVVLTPVVLLAAVIGGLMLSAPSDGHQPGLADVGWTELDLTSADTADSWITIGNARVRLDLGARLFRAGAPGYANLVKLEGSARFLRVPPPDAPYFGDAFFFTVYTAAGFVASPQGDFRIDARADTTDIEVLPRMLPRTGGGEADTGSNPRAKPDVVLIAAGPGGRAGTLLLNAGEAARLRLEAAPIKLRHVPTDPGSDWLFRRLLVLLSPWILP
jgi:hypothetical protein